jgi:hypothetical protein
MQAYTARISTLTKFRGKVVEFALGKLKSGIVLSQEQKAFAIETT